MAFLPISPDNYIKKHLENIPSDNEETVRSRLQRALEAYKKGVKCSCGNTIWVIGSASVGNSCFSCITGEHFPDNDYEIDSALKKENTGIRGKRPEKVFWRLRFWRPEKNSPVSHSKQ